MRRDEVRITYYVFRIIPEYLRYTEYRIRNTVYGIRNTEYGIRGQTIPGSETIQKMASALKVDQRILLRLAGHLDVEPVSEIDPEALYLAQRLTALPPQQRALAFNAVSQMIEALSIGYA